MNLPGGFEIWIILLVILLLFGAKKLPELARSLGRSSKEFKDGLAEGSKAGDNPEESKAADAKASETKAEEKPE